MKIRQQGALLVGIPLVCQILAGTVLIRNFMLVEQAGMREIQAKTLISTCQEIRSIGVRAMIVAVGQELMVSQERIVSLADVSRVSKEKFQLMEKLLAGDDTSLKMARKFKKDVQKLIEVLGDAGQIIEDPTVPSWADRKNLLLTRYLNEQELLQEAMVVYQQCIEDEEVLIKRFTPVVREWQPKALRERHNLLTSIIAAVVVEVILWIVLSIFIGKKFVDRLSVLMKHIKCFGAGKPVEGSVTGNDELTELDVSFREMANAKYEAEEQKRTLMSMVTHDIRSPITAANLTINVILDTKADQLDTWVTSRLRRLGSDMQRLCRLANSLLDIEKIESGKLELELGDCTATEIIESAVNCLEPTAAAKKMEIETRIDGDLALFCDKERIIQVMINLLSNAIKFGPKGSKIQIDVSSADSGQFVRFEVIDQGKGVSEEDSARLFQKFCQLGEQETRKQGSGFGLYLASMIISAHGGKIGYDHIDLGSRFFFALPSATNKATNRD